MRMPLKLAVAGVIALAVMQLVHPNIPSRPGIPSEATTAERGSPLRHTLLISRTGHFEKWRP
jgi:hypothetical protein